MNIYDVVHLIDLHVIRIYQEGPNECDVVLLKDQKTLWAVMRVDGGDGTPSHRTLPFLASTSTDGVSWTPAAPLPVRMSLCILE
eukprot:COSAG06_NODE_91_length_24730_cov_26.482603_17_plen_84_part_00